MKKGDKSAILCNSKAFKQLTVYKEVFLRVKKEICIHIYTYLKKNLSEGSLGVCIFINLSYRDYLQRGVKTGINYPHTCVITCIRVIKIPVWPHLKAENKRFCQFHLQFWATFLCHKKRPTENDCSCQLSGKIDKSLCIHALEHL